jgi:hypothetical protein
MHAPGTWRPTWRKCRIQDVDINADIDSRAGYPLFDFVNDAMNANAINVPGCDNLKAISFIILDIAISQDGCSDTHVDGRVVDQALFMSNMEKCAVIYSTITTDDGMR